MNPLPRHQNAFTDEAFLNEFDLKRRPLFAVKKAFANGDLVHAKAALVQHFKVRKNPRWVFDLRDGTHGEVPHLWPTQCGGDNQEHIDNAEKACRNVLALGHDLTLRFDARLEWNNKDTCSHFVPGNAFKCCHFFRWLAIAWADTGDPRYAVKFAELTERWRRDWPFQLDDDFDGSAMIFHDATGEKSMPTGQRLFNWLACLYSGIPFAPEVPVETAFQFIKSIWFAGAAYQYFENSKFHAHNHHIMRTCNVPGVIAMMFPETPRVTRMLDMVRDNMRRHLAGSFLSDGGYIERTSSYATVTLSMFLANLVLGRLNRVKLLGQKDVAIIRRAAEQMALTVLPAGGLPQVGDGYAGRPEMTRGFLWLLKEGIGSAVADAVMKKTGLSRELPPPLWSAASRKKQQKAVSLPTTVRYAATGIGLIRSGWSKKASALVMIIPDAENTGNSHAHDDALSVELQIRGKSFLGQPAGELYLHVNQPKYRLTPYYGWFYSMKSKSLVLAEGRPLRTPEWLATRPQVRPPAVTSSLSVVGGKTILSGSHTGYERFEVSRTIVHTRSQWEVRDQVVCTDGMRGRKKHVLQWCFDYGVEVVRDGYDLLVSHDGGQIRIQFQAERLASIQLVRNRKWMRPNKGRSKEPAPWVARVRFGGAESDVITTTIRQK